MRGRRVFILAAMIAAPLAARADPPAAPQTAAPPLTAQTHPPPPHAAPARPPESSADLSFYPSAALMAGVEGEAIVTCDRNEHLRLVNCKVTSEKPDGQGFGAAALSLAAKSPDNPKLNLADPKDHAPVTFPVYFTQHPPKIEPDLTQMLHQVTPASLVTSPTRSQIEAAYPTRALSDGIDGAALIDCMVSKAGALGGCQLLGENPSGYGFGAAALDLAADFTLKPRLVDGAPVDGAEVRVPVQFQATDPSAPLELKTTPAP